MTGKAGNHDDIYIRLVQPVDKDVDIQVANDMLPEIRVICSNKVRASILHLLINSIDTLHSMQVEDLAYRIGERPRVVIYHLERMKDWKLVEVKKNKKYGDGSRRTIWGLDLRHPAWLSECYNNVRTYFFDEKELKEMTSKNMSFRSASKINVL